MSREWEHNFTNIVNETESNLARIRQRLDGSRLYNQRASPSSYQDNSSMLPRTNAYGLSTSISRTDYSNFSERRPHSSYSAPAIYRASSEGESLLSSSSDSPAVIALLTEKIDNQEKIIHSLSRQMEAFEREKDRNQTHLKRLDQELLSLSRRLQQKGLNLDTERKVDEWKQEIMAQLNDLQGQARGRRWDSLENRHGDEVLNSLTREVHDFKRQIQDDLVSCRREIDSLNTRLLRHEVDIGNNHTDGKDLSRRLDHLDRTLVSVSDSQRNQSRDLGHTLQDRRASDQELQQLRTDLSHLMSTFERVESKVLKSSQGVADEQRNSLKMKSLHSNGQPATSTQSRSVAVKDNARNRKTVASYKSSRHRQQLKSEHSQQQQDFDCLDSSSSSLSLASSGSDDDVSLDIPPHYAKNVQRNIRGVYAKGDDESSEAFSEPTSALVEHDPTLDLVDLASTSSISSIELDTDLL